jgi:fucose permease
LSDSLQEVSASKRALAGFVLSGMILAFPGAILPAWGYHLRPHYVTVGNYFLAVVAGVLLAVRASGFTLRRRGISGTLTIGCAFTALAFITLSFTAPPVNEWWRVPGLVGLGFGAGLLNTAIFQAMSPAYRLNPAETVNLAGIFFGLGSCLSPLFIAGTFNYYGVETILRVAALIPVLFAILYSRLTLVTYADVSRRSVKEMLREFTVPEAVLLSLLLFFHFGNEWSISGWLPLFLILRLGMSPVDALILLAAYWLSLMLGRIAVQAVLPWVSHAKLLFACVLCALFGCLVLTFTNNSFGAWLGTLLVGVGFAPIYPLVVEKIGGRFPLYHPGLFNGIFSVALTGGLLAPATLGYAAEYLGIRIVTALPAVGTFVVLVLVLVIWTQAKLATLTSAKPNGDGPL